MKLGIPFVKCVRLLLTGVALGAAGAARSQTAIVKSHAYLQTSAGLAEPYPNAPFQADVYSEISATVTEPNGQALSLTYDAGSLDYLLFEGYQTQAELDQAFPDGTYQFSPTISVGLTGDYYPPAPVIMNGTWNASGQLVIDPAAQLELGFNTFTGYNTPGLQGEVSFEINYPGTAQSVNSMYWSSAKTPVVPVGVTVPALSLALEGPYDGSLIYSTYTASGITANAIYVSITQFSVVFPAVSSAPPPAILTQPVSATVAVGSSAAFSCTASGSPTYQWYQNGEPLFAATDSILVVHNAQAAQVGTYTCVASNSSGSAISNGASLAVVSTTNPGRLVNISCRAQVGTGADILIAGFVVGGAGTAGSKDLLIRGSGPALVPFGLTGVLPDPELQLFSGPTLLNSNTGWAGSTLIAATAASVGAFPWPDTTSHDAALVQLLAGGAYTAQVSGQADDAGIGLVEVYDATAAGAYTPASPRIINLSARVEVGQGSNILIAGFVISGATSRTVLIRGSGPALTPLGVDGVLPDPELQLFAGTQVLASNQGWAGDATIAGTASAVGAFAWNNPASADSAIIATLPPGSYTAQISGASNDTGVALVEIYEVP